MIIGSLPFEVSVKHGQTKHSGNKVPHVSGTVGRWPLKARDPKLAKKETWDDAMEEIFVRALSKITASEANTNEHVFGPDDQRGKAANAHAVSCTGRGCEAF